MEIVQHFTGKICEILPDDMIVVRTTNGHTRGLWRDYFHPNHRHMLDIGWSVQVTTYYENCDESRRRIEEFKVIIPQDTSRFV